MKLAPPRLPLQLSSELLDSLLEGELEAATLTGIDAAKCNVLALDIDGVRIDTCSFTQAQLTRISAKDVIIERSDFSSASFSDGVINRGVFANCRMTGTDFNKSTLHDVVFRGCKLNLANFRFADLRRVRFIDCDLTETDFLNATIHEVTFETCTLERTVFDQAKCKQVDLRTSELLEISGWGSLKGAIIDDIQLASVAPYLANELGLSVR